MLRALVLGVAIALIPMTVHAESGRRSEDVRGAKKLSVSAGVGFLSDVDSFGGTDQFLMQFDVLYNFTNILAAGAVLQAGPAWGSSTVAMSFEGRAYLPIEGEGFARRLAPYVGVGLGFRTYTNINTEFLFPIIIGLEYDMSDSVSLTSDMRFNIASGYDTFYYSWQIVGARVRF
jgi:hypothetical protein